MRTCYLVAKKLGVGALRSESFNLEYRLVSSAYIETEEVFKACEKSLMYNRTKSGLRHDP